MGNDYKVTYHYKQQYKVELAMTDLALLLFLYDQALLSQHQLFRYYTLISDFKSEAAFRRKMAKWHEAGLVKKTKKNIVNGYQLALLRITEAGLNLLKDLAFLPSSINRKYASKTNIDHTLAVKEAFIDFLLAKKESNQFFYVSDRENVCIPLRKDFAIYYKHLQKVGDIYDKKEGLINSSYEYIEFKEVVKEAKLKMNNLDQTLYQSVKPDLSFYYDEKIIFIEIDTGTENIGTLGSENKNTILGKVKRYDELAIKDAVILFLVLDNKQNLKTVKEYSNRTKRIRNMKVAIDYAFIETDMQIYVLPFSRGLNRLTNFKSNSYFEKKVMKIEKNRMIIIELIRKNLLNKGDVKYISNNLISKSNDILLYSEELKMHFLILFSEEGSYSNLRKISEYYYGMTKGGLPDSRIILFYLNKDEMVQDIILTPKIMLNPYFCSEIFKTYYSFAVETKSMLFDLNNKKVEF